MAQAGVPASAAAAQSSLALRLVESDLQSLSQEARRSSGLSAVKEACDRALAAMRRIQLAGPSYIQSGDGSVPYTTVSYMTTEALVVAQALQPLALLCCGYAGDAPKRLLLLALGAVQRLVSSDSVPEAEYATVLRLLDALSSSGEDDVRLRVLQSLPLLLSGHKAGLPFEPQLLPHVLALGFGFLRDKTPVIRHAASAALQQAMALLFERAASQATQLLGENNSSDASSAASPPPPRMPALLSCCARLVQDMALVAGGLPYNVAAASAAAAMAVAEDASAKGDAAGPQDGSTAAAAPAVAPSVALAPLPSATPPRPSGGGGGGGLFSFFTGGSSSSSSNSGSGSTSSSGGGASAAASKSGVSGTGTNLSTGSGGAAFTGPCIVHVPRVLAADLLWFALRDHAWLFASPALPAFRSLIGSAVVPLLLRQLPSQQSFPLVLRFCRITRELLRQPQLISACPGPLRALLSLLIRMVHGCASGADLGADAVKVVDRFGAAGARILREARRALGSGPGASSSAAAAENDDDDTAKAPASQQPAQSDVSDDHGSSHGDISSSSEEAKLLASVSAIPLGPMPLWKCALLLEALHGALAVSPPPPPPSMLSSMSSTAAGKDASAAADPLLSSSALLALFVAFDLQQQEQPSSAAAGGVKSATTSTGGPRLTEQLLDALSLLVRRLCAIPASSSFGGLPPRSTSRDGGAPSGGGIGGARQGIPSTGGRLRQNSAGGFTASFDENDVTAGSSGGMRGSMSEGHGASGGASGADVSGGGAAGASQNPLLDEFSLYPGDVDMAADGHSHRPLAGLECHDADSHIFTSTAGGVAALTAGSASHGQGGAGGAGSGVGAGGGAGAGTGTGSTSGISSSSSSQGSSSSSSSSSSAGAVGAGSYGFAGLVAGAAVALVSAAASPLTSALGSSGPAGAAAAGTGGSGGGGGPGASDGASGGQLSSSSSVATGTGLGEVVLAPAGMAPATIVLLATEILACAGAALTRGLATRLLVDDAQGGDGAVYLQFSPLISAAAAASAHGSSGGHGASGGSTPQPPKAPSSTSPTSLDALTIYRSLAGAMWRPVTSALLTLFQFSDGPALGCFALKAVTCTAQAVFAASAAAGGGAGLQGWEAVIVTLCRLAVPKWSPAHQQVIAAALSLCAPAGGSLASLPPATVSSSSQSNAPPGSTSSAPPLTSKQMLVLRALLTLVHRQGNALPQQLWLVIWDTLHQFLAALEPVLAAAAQASGSTNAGATGAGASAPSGSSSAYALLASLCGTPYLLLDPSAWGPGEGLELAATGQSRGDGGSKSGGSGGSGSGAGSDGHHHGQGANAGAILSFLRAKLSVHALDGQHQHQQQHGDSDALNVSSTSMGSPTGVVNASFASFTTTSNATGGTASRRNSTGSASSFTANNGLFAPRVGPPALALRCLSEGNNDSVIEQIGLSDASYSLDYKSSNVMTTSAAAAAAASAAGASDLSTLGGVDLDASMLSTFSANSAPGGGSGVVRWRLSGVSDGGGGGSGEVWDGSGGDVDGLVASGATFTPIASTSSAGGGGTPAPLAPPPPPSPSHDADLLLLPVGLATLVEATVYLSPSPLGACIGALAQLSLWDIGASTSVSLASSSNSHHHHHHKTVPVPLPALVAGADDTSDAEGGGDDASDVSDHEEATGFSDEDQDDNSGDEGAAPSSSRAVASSPVRPPQGAVAAVTGASPVKTSSPLPPRVSSAAVAVTAKAAPATKRSAMALGDGFTIEWAAGEDAKDIMASSASPAPAPVAAAPSSSISRGSSNSAALAQLRRARQQAVSAAKAAFSTSAIPQPKRVRIGHVALSHRSDLLPPFSLLRLIETAALNGWRWTAAAAGGDSSTNDGNMWRPVSLLLRLLAQASSQSLRAFGSAATTELALAQLQGLCSALQPVGLVPSSPRTSRQAQSLDAGTLLTPLLSYWRSPHGDARVAALACARRVMESTGGALSGHSSSSSKRKGAGAAAAYGGGSSGWDVVLALVFCVSAGISGVDVCNHSSVVPIGLSINAATSNSAGGGSRAPSPPPPSSGNGLTSSSSQPQPVSLHAPLPLLTALPPALAQLGHDKHASDLLLVSSSSGSFQQQQLQRSSRDSPQPGTPFSFGAAPPPAPSLSPLGSRLFTDCLQLLQTLLDDHTDRLSSGHMTLVVAALSLLSRQGGGTDLNSALTASGLLWKLSDVLVQAGQSHGGFGSSPSPAGAALEDVSRLHTLQLQQPQQQASSGGQRSARASKALSLWLHVWHALLSQSDGSSALSLPVAVRAGTSAVASAVNNGSGAGWGWAWGIATVPAASAEVRNACVQALCESALVLAQAMATSSSSAASAGRGPSPVSSLLRLLLCDRLLPLARQLTFLARAAAAASSASLTGSGGGNRARASGGPVKGGGSSASDVTAAATAAAAAKAWNETRVIALRGVTRIITACWESLCRIEISESAPDVSGAAPSSAAGGSGWFSALWIDYVGLLQSCIVPGDATVGGEQDAPVVARSRAGTATAASVSSPSAAAAAAVVVSEPLDVSSCAVSCLTDLALLVAVPGLCGPSRPAGDEERVSFNMRVVDGALVRVSGPGLGSHTSSTSNLAEGSQQHQQQQHSQSHHNQHHSGGWMDEEDAEEGDGAENGASAATSKHQQASDAAAADSTSGGGLASDAEELASSVTSFLATALTFGAYGRSSSPRTTPSASDAAADAAAQASSAAAKAQAEAAAKAAAAAAYVSGLPRLRDRLWGEILSLLKRAVFTLPPHHAPSSGTAASGGKDTDDEAVPSTIVDLLLGIASSVAVPLNDTTSAVPSAASLAVAGHASRFSELFGLVWACVDVRRAAKWAAANGLSVAIVTFKGLSVGQQQQQQQAKGSTKGGSGASSRSSSVLPVTRCVPYRVLLSAPDVSAADGTGTVVAEDLTGPSLDIPSQLDRVVLRGCDRFAGALWLVTRTVLEKAGQQQPQQKGGKQSLAAAYAAAQAQLAQAWRSFLELLLALSTLRDDARYASPLLRAGASGVGGGMRSRTSSLANTNAMIDTYCHSSRQQHEDETSPETSRTERASSEAAATGGDFNDSSAAVQLALPPSALSSQSLRLLHRLYDSNGDLKPQEAATVRLTGGTSTTAAAVGAASAAADEAAAASAALDASVCALVVRSLRDAAFSPSGGITSLAAALLGARAHVEHASEAIEADNDRRNAAINGGKSTAKKADSSSAAAAGTGAATTLELDAASAAMGFRLPPLQLPASTVVAAGNASSGSGGGSRKGAAASGGPSRTPSESSLVGFAMGNASAFSAGTSTSSTVVYPIKLWGFGLGGSYGPKGDGGLVIADNSKANRNVTRTRSHVSALLAAMVAMVRKFGGGENSSGSALQSTPSKDASKPSASSGTWLSLLSTLEIVIGLSSSPSSSTADGLIGLAVAVPASSPSSAAAGSVGPGQVMRRGGASSAAAATADAASSASSTSPQQPMAPLSTLASLLSSIYAADEAPSSSSGSGKGSGKASSAKAPAANKASSPVHNLPSLASLAAGNDSTASSPAGQYSLAALRLDESHTTGAAALKRAIGGASSSGPAGASPADPLSALGPRAALVDGAPLTSALTDPAVTSAAAHLGWDSSVWASLCAVITPSSQSAAAAALAADDGKKKGVVPSSTATTTTSAAAGSSASASAASAASGGLDAEAFMLAAVMEGYELALAEADAAVATAASVGAAGASGGNSGDGQVESALASSPSGAASPAGSSSSSAAVPSSSSSSSSGVPVAFLSFTHRLVCMLSVGSALLGWNPWDEIVLSSSSSSPSSAAASAAEQSSSFLSPSSPSSSSGSPSADPEVDRRRRVFGRLCLCALLRLAQLDGHATAKHGSGATTTSAVSSLIAETARDLLLKRATAMLAVHARLEGAAALAAVSSNRNSTSKSASSSSPAAGPALSAPAVLDAAAALLLLQTLLRAAALSPSDTPALAGPFNVLICLVPSAHPLLRLLATKALATIGTGVFGQ